MGSTVNGYMPYDIIYEYTDQPIVIGNRTLFPHNPTTIPCNEEVELWVNLLKKIFDSRNLSIILASYNFRTAAPVVAQIARNHALFHHHESDIVSLYRTCT